MQNILNFKSNLKPWPLAEISAFDKLVHDVIKWKWSCLFTGSTILKYARRLLLQNIENVRLVGEFRAG